MRYGAMNFPATPVLDEIDVFARLGFDYLELAMDPPCAHHEQVAKLKNLLIAKLRDAGLGLVCHLPTFVLPVDLTKSIRDASINEMRASLALAAELSAEKVVLHPPMVSGLGVFVIDMVKQYANDFLDEMMAAAANLQLTICLENMFPRNILGVEPEDLNVVFQKFPELRMTLDLGHANIADKRGDRLQRLITMFCKHIRHLHFSDNQGVRDDHWPIGKGNIDFRAVLTALVGWGYDDTITFEVFDPDRSKLVASREMVKTMLAEGLSAT